MKRLFAILLAVFLLITFAGCSQKPPQVDPHDHNHTQTETTAIKETSPSTTTKSTVQVAPTEETAEHTESYTQSPTYTDPQVVVLSDTLQRGEISGNTYASSTLGLNFTKPAEWTFAEEPDLAYYSGISSGDFGDFAATASENSAVYDMYATNKDGCIVSICYENLLITVGETLSSKEYAQIIKNAIYDSPNSSVTEGDKITLGKRAYSKLIITSSDETGNITKTYYLTPVGNYMATIIVTLPENSNLSADSLFS